MLSGRGYEGSQNRTLSGGDRGPRGHRNEKCGTAMLFSIDEDTGSRIVGWVMPDNPATTPKVVIHLGPEHHVVMTPLWCVRCSGNKASTILAFAASWWMKIIAPG